jgi:hypothetical protein
MLEFKPVPGYVNALASPAQKREFCLVAVVFGFKLLKSEESILRLLADVSNLRWGVSKNFFSERVWIFQNCRRFRGSCPALSDKKVFSELLMTWKSCHVTAARLTIQPSALRMKIIDSS